MQKSSIPWTDYTSNPIRARNRETGATGHYCVKVSRGCRNCYASAFQMRYGTGLEFVPANREKVELYLHEPELQALVRTRRTGRVFICDMTDLFQEDVPDAWLFEVWMTMAISQHLTFQVLTKRPERMREWVTKLNEPLPGGHKVFADRFWPLPNVWLGTSVEDQRAADERIPFLLDTPAAVRFLSVEPMLGPVDLAPYVFDGDEHWDGGSIQVDWVICGGESAGPPQRRMDLAWMRSLRDQCRSARVPFFAKQPSHRLPDRFELLPPDLQVREWPEAPA